MMVMRRSAPFGRLFVVVLLLLLQAVPAAAKQRRDTAFMRLYQRYFQLYNEPEHEQEFWKASEQMKAYYRKVGNTDAYYKMRQNEVLYDLDQGRSYHAIKRTNEILEEMKSEGVDYYHIVYASLGTVYESRGNYRMAHYYFTQALTDVAPTDSGALISIYSRLASLQSTREPQQAWQWNEKFGQMTVKYPDYHKVYLALKGQICFFMGDKAKFEQVNREFAEYVKGKTFADDYGVACMQIFDKAFGGDYDGALAQLASGDISGLDTLGILDVRGRIYEMMGRYDLSLRASYMRRDLRDSLNSDLMYDNINAVNAEMGLTQLNERTAREREEMIRQTAREREQWLAVVIGLLLTALCLIVWRHLTRRRYQKQLLRQNKALETALDRAQESDRMKMAFIEQVSHEIRTPLNV
ncbi:MAG: hypothetical protein IJ637_06840, partial [Prevotella sp.]|nr:hypothetical protein [Prevotella sp.]